MLLILLFILLITNNLYGSYKAAVSCTETTSAVQQAQALAEQFSASGHPVHLNLNVVTNENTQVSAVNIFDYPRKLLTDGKEKFSGSITTLWEYIKNNKSSVLLHTCIALAASAQLRLWYLKLKLRSSTLWSQSQSEKPIEELYQIPQKTLGFKLLGEIQKVYMQLDNPTNFVGPLILFIKDTEREKAILEEYKAIVAWADKLYLKKLLFYDAVLLEIIPERLNKLAYLKNSFLNWLAEFKASHPQEFLQTRSRKSGFVLTREFEL